MLELWLTLFPNFQRAGDEFIKAIGQTLQMVGISGFVAFFFGLFFGVILIIGGIILAVLNVFNIRERKYEIGVLAAIGMKKTKIALQYAIELLVRMCYNELRCFIY